MEGFLTAEKVSIPNPHMVQGSTVIIMATMAGVFSMCKGTVFGSEGHMSLSSFRPHYNAVR